LVFPFKSCEIFNIVLDEEHEIFRTVVKDFMEKEVRPELRLIEQKDEFPQNILGKASQMGFFGLGIPTQYSGQGENTMMLALFNEESARVCQAFSEITCINKLFTTPILLYGTEEQKRLFVPEIATGKKFASHATSEPGAGSDVAGISTKAKKEAKEKWRLNGTKYFVTGGDRADYFIVLARTNSESSNEKRSSGLTYFVVNKNDKGVIVSKPIPKLGLRGSHIVQVNFEDVGIPDENKIGNEGQGFKIAMETYNRGRVMVAARAVGLAQAAFEKSLTYSTSRKTFGETIASHETIQNYLVDMLMRVVTSRLLTYWAANLYDKKDQEYIIAASMAKTFASESAELNASKAINIHGGAGVISDTLVDRLLRDASITKIYEGTNEIQHSIIMKQILSMSGLGETKRSGSDKKST
jgi:alkylation response protein AidB-like acyl-CoA dehydrogenase